jgi:hypothetical protein
MTRKKMGFPRFKNKYRLRSFVYPQLGTGQILKDNQIKLPQLGWMKYVKSRPIPDGFKVKQVRIVRKASGYFLMVILESDVSVPDTVASGHPRGIDLGLDKFAVTSDGELIERWVSNPPRNILLESPSIHRGEYVNVSTSSQAPEKLSLPDTVRGFSVSQISKNWLTSGCKVTSFQVRAAKLSPQESASVKVQS